MAKKTALPASYLKWLDRMGPDDLAQFGGREWELADRDGLAETVNIDGNEAPYLEQVKLYVQSIAEATGEDGTVDDQENEIPFARMKKWLALGSENEDVLCVDPGDGFSVWCFCPGEGGMVERLADSLDEWMEQVEIVQ